MNKKLITILILSGFLLTSIGSVSGFVMNIEGDPESIFILRDEGFKNSPWVSNPDADGTEDDPYIIEGWNITTNTNHGIYVYNTTKIGIYQR